MPSLNLLQNSGECFSYQESSLHQARKELEDLLDGLKYFQTLKFAKQSMLYQGIKYNNTIEGINDDLSIIERVIRRRKNPMSATEARRITNVYHGYKYILEHKAIDKEHLQELYSILSNSLLSEEDKQSMGEYYRLNDVVIESDIHLYDKTYKGTKPSQIEEYMDLLFDFINSANPQDGIDVFIKSQIMHFYFVYIHPFYDVNGRTSRTLSMWYLLNNKSYPFVVFNRAISFRKKEYYKYIERCRDSGDLTLFLKYMLTQVERELEKEYLIMMLKKNSKATLSHEECQTIQYLLSMKGSIEEGNLTVKDLATIYNRFNKRQPVSEILAEKVEPLIEKGILTNMGFTKSLIAPSTPNFHLGLNKSLLDIDDSKVEHLSLKRYRK